MKRNIWIYLLGFSLALNLGVLATYTYMRYQNQAFWQEPRQLRPLQEMWGFLNLEPNQKKALENLLPKHRRRVRDLRAQLSQKRLALCEMAKEGTGAWPAMQAKVKEVSALQGKLEEEVLRFCLAFQEHLKPEQRTAFMTFIDHRMFGVQGGKGRRSPHWRSGMGVGTHQTVKPCDP
jgi:Spy/CpxP family protein refolding chaperone